MFSKSQARRFSLKEFLLLLLPCLLLAIFALAMRNRGGNTIDLNKRFALTMEKYEFEPVTPREVSQGYSAKLKVTFNHVGPTPAWWGKPSDDSGSNNGATLIYRDGNSSRPARLPPNFKWGADILFWRPHYDEESDRYIARFLVPLAKIPVRKADVVLQAEVAISDQNRKRLCQPISIEVVLRKAGEPGEFPRVSTNPHLVVKKIEVIRLIPVIHQTDGLDSVVRQLDGFDTEVRVTLRYSGPIEGEKDPINNLGLGGGNSTVVDSLGQDLGLSSTESGNINDPNHSNPPYTTITFTRFALSAYTRKMGALFYKAEYSLNDSWPLRVRIPLRDAKGRDLLTKNTLAP